jgi:hypothetical protein
VVANHEFRAAGPDLEDLADQRELPRAWFARAGDGEQQERDEEQMSSAHGTW